VVKKKEKRMSNDGNFVAHQYVMLFMIFLKKVSSRGFELVLCFEFGLFQFLTSVLGHIRSLRLVKIHENPFACLLV
jgi:hypothetical protein